MVCGERLFSTYAFADDAGDFRCGLCRRVEPGFARAAAFGSYEGGLRELIHLLKFSGVRPAANVLGRMLAEAITTLESGFPSYPVAVIPVPLHGSKRRQRGFNQVELIARATLKLKDADSTRLHLCSGVLEKKRETISQIGLTSHQRRENLRGAFRVAQPEAVKGREVLVVDDVYTTGATVKALKRGRDNVAAQIEAGGKAIDVSVERVILAVGIVGNVEDVGLEGTKVKVEKTHVVVDEWLRTDEPGLYAIGDLVGPPWLAHKAMHEGVICVEHIAGLNDVHPLDTRNIPACTYCRPQIASVGLTEKAARDAGYEVKIGHFPFIGNGKAIALGEPEGMVKTVFDSKTGELLGAHMVGAEVTELIQGYTIAKTLETTESELMRTIFPHPTISETMHEAVLDAYGRAIHF